MKGTGAGPAEPLEEEEQVLLDALRKADSDVVEGVEGGLEVGLNESAPLEKEVNL